MFGAEIAKKRKELGMTQKQFSEYIGRSVRTIINWEQGNVIPDTATRREMCRLLGIDLKNADLDYDSDLFPDEQRLLRIYRCLDNEGKELIQHVAKVLDSYQIRNNGLAMLPRLKAYQESYEHLKNSSDDEQEGEHKET